MKKMSSSDSSKTSGLNPEKSLADGQPHGQIQKISQEGSKNTYVIILSKDYLKSESSKAQSFLSCPSVVKSKHGNQGTKVVDKKDDEFFESPSAEIGVRQKKLRPLPEDVKLNLSNIKDDDYDSNQSSSNVFLRQESSLQEQDSALGLDCDFESSKMDLSDNPLKFSQQPCKAGIKQHVFKKTYSPKLGEQCPKPGFTAYSPVDNSCKSSTRNIVSVKTAEHEAGLKKTYNNVAVPTMGRSSLSSYVPSTLLPKNNHKAVPTFSNLISPISQENTSHPPQSCFMPISPAESTATVSVSAGPFTSTPVTAETHRRVQQVKQESSTHRSVYIIPSPFNRQNNCNTSSLLGNQSQTDTWSPVTQSSAFNNSSGFISASSSLDTPDSSVSFDGESGRPLNKLLSPSEFKEMYTDADCKSDGSGGVVVSVDDDEDIEELDLGLGSLNPSLTSSQESETCVPTEKGSLNQSLTNMQWLKGMQLKEDSSSSLASQQQQQHNLHWMQFSAEEIKAISEDCGRDKRPPFSYCSLIQMALYSREDRKMMLKEICKWIEETFPYFQYTAKPGWRNSIRHNLSLYNIFEREPAKRHGSYWMLKCNVEPKMKQYHRGKETGKTDLPCDSYRSLPTLPSQIPIIPMYSSMGQLSAVSPQAFSNSLQLPHNTANKKKGPPPILPRPSAYKPPQAYALIPISSVGSTLRTAPSPNPLQHQVLLNMSACPSPIISEVSAAVASIQVSSASPVPPEHFCDSKSLQKEHFYNKPMNIVKQAWINCQTNETASSVDSDQQITNDVLSSSEIASSSEFSGRGVKSKRPRVKPGLPKPTMYKTEETRVKTTGSKRRKLQQKAKSMLTESSDEEEDGAKFISCLEKEIFSRGSKSLEAEDVAHLLNTSTPAKTLSHSTTDLPSPLGNLTLLRGTGLFDTSFLETLADRKALGLSPDLGDEKRSSHSSPRLGDDPDDFLDFNVLSPLDRYEGSPSQGNANLSRILGEYGLDTATDNSENFPHLNWSVVDQMVSNMDTA